MRRFPGRCRSRPKREESHAPVECRMHAAIRSSLTRSWSRVCLDLFLCAHRSPLELQSTGANALCFCRHRRSQSTKRSCTGRTQSLFQVPPKLLPPPSHRPRPRWKRDVSAFAISCVLRTTSHSHHCAHAAMCPDALTHDQRRSLIDPNSASHPTADTHRVSCQRATRCHTCTRNNKACFVRTDRACLSR